MPATNDSALLLASQLRSSSDADLRELLDARPVRSTGVRDLFDLADALLEESSVQSALTRLDRYALATLAGLAELGRADEHSLVEHVTAASADADAERIHQALPRLQAHALLTRHESEFVALQAVSEVLRGWPADGLPSPRELLTTPPPAALAPVAEIDRTAVDAIAVERAFTATGAIAELVAALELDPAQELARGGLALPDVKRLAAACGVELDEVASLVRIGERAGLIERDGDHLTVSERALSWQSAGTADRWAALARTWLEELSPHLRELLAARAPAQWGERLDEYVDWLYPAGGSWIRDRLATLGSDATLLGIIARDTPSTAGAALFSSPAEASAALTAALPAEVSTVYIQHDLSVIATGPLSPVLERRLRAIAVPESRGLASTWRISDASLTRALTTGLTAGDIRAFLTTASLSGIPQPLDYALRQAEQRFGLVRVSATTDGRAHVSSREAGLVRAIHADRALAPLGLVHDGEGLRSRFDRDVVFFALADARYPVLAEESDGTLVALERRRPPRSRPEAPSPAEALIRRLRESASAPEHTEETWLARQLEAAIRNKLTVTVSIRMPDGSTSDLRLEPTSISRGRLRARDRGADLERTLPLSSITAVRTA